MSEPLTTVAQFLEACAAGNLRVNAIVCAVMDEDESLATCDDIYLQYLPPYATAVPGDPDQGNLWWEMWLALPREGEGWYYALRELAPCPDFAFRVRPFQIDGFCPAKNVNFSCGTPPFGDTPNAALAAALLLALDKLKETDE